jgi:hypothetical protein
MINHTTFGDYLIYIFCFYYLFAFFWESNPKEYWKLLDQLKSKDNDFSEDASHVPENEWYDYLKLLNEDTFTD